MGYLKSLTLLLVVSCLSATELVYPDAIYARDSGGLPIQAAEVACVNVKAYGALGDGSHDDTAAINAALNHGRSQTDRPPDYYSARPRTVYLPPGTYRVTGMLTWIGINLTMRGAGRADTVIRLDDTCSGFANAGAPVPVIRCWRTGNYGFSQNIRDLTVNTGSGNAGAIGIEYNASNTGALQNVLVTGSGVCGVDMTQDWPGPCLVKRLEVQGFQVGLDIRTPEYGPTFEDLTFSGQSVAGLRNDNNTLAIRRLTSTNSVPAVLSTGSKGHVILLDATCSGGAGGRSAVELGSGDTAYLRTITATGYGSALKTGTTVVPGSTISERVVGPIRHLFGSVDDAASRMSLKLPVQETPTFHDNDPNHWGRLQRSYEYNTWDANANSDITAGMTTINQAVFYAPSCTTVWINTGSTLSGVSAGVPLEQAGFRVPAHVRRFTGFANNFNRWGSIGLVLRVQDESPNPLIIDDVRGDVTIYHNCARTVVLRNGQFSYKAAPGAGPLFLEDAGMNNVTTVPGQRVWARQLNIEGSQLHMDNNGGDLWVFGLKTENGGMVAKTRNGGRTEFLGTLLYALRPSGTAFETTDGHCSMSYVTSNYTGEYATQAHETRLGVSQTLPTGNAGSRYAMPMYVGWTSDRAAACATAPLVGATMALSARADGSGGVVTWTSVPSGVTFSPNGTSGAASATATFPGPGSYTLTASFADGSSSTVMVNVPAPATSGGGGGGGCGLGGLIVLGGLLSVLRVRRSGVRRP